MVLNLSNAGASATINTAINGGSFGDHLQNSLTSAVANTVGAIGFNASANSLNLGWERGVGHALVGATTGYVVGGDSESALAGAAGAIASYGISHGLGSSISNSDVLSGIAQVGGVLAGTLITGDGDNAATGQDAASLEFQYNYLSHKDIDELNKKIKKCDGDDQCKRDVRNWAARRDLVNEKAQKACGTDQQCLLEHAKLNQAGIQALGNIDGNYLTQVPGLTDQIKIWNRQDFKLIPQHLQTPAILGGFAISQCNGVWTPACAGAFQAEVKRQEGNAKLLVGGTVLAGAMPLATACAANPICATFLVGTDLVAFSSGDPTALVGLGGLGTVAKVEGKVVVVGSSTHTLSNTIARDTTVELTQAIKLSDGTVLPAGTVVTTNGNALAAKLPNGARIHGNADKLIQTQPQLEMKPNVTADSGSAVDMDGHKIYDPKYPPLSTNPKEIYRFSDPAYRPGSTGQDIYFGENIATSYYEVRQDVFGKSLYVGKVKVDNMLDLTDPTVLKQMNIDPQKLIRVAPDGDSKLAKATKNEVYTYTNSIANQAYDKGYSGIIYPSSRNTRSTNNSAVVLFGGRYDPAKITPILDKPIATPPKK